MKKLSLLYILFLISCAHDDPAAGPLTLEFDNRFEDHPGSTITYDIIDIKLKRDDGLIFHDGQARHVDAANEASQEIELNGISSGSYVEVTFVIKSIDVHGPVEFTSADSQTVTLTTPRTPVRPEHQPEVHLVFDIDKLSTSVQAAFVVDHIHEN